MSGCITTKTVIENQALIIELWGSEVCERAMTTTCKTWIEFLTSEGIF